ncbi:BURP domain protein RD22-like [Lycium ferocissimum]|uniref:BURP domain protein RD22-like n=1 Tax=Lycium ferocissimum TaxID=112874 RepID=UPI002815C8CD|nr:BURP domain protein RD22-like [Lycium ferocissimum]
MKLQALPIFMVAFVASTHATLSPEIYWKVKLPNTQIPKVIKNFLPQPELKQDNTNTKEKVYYGLNQAGYGLNQAGYGLNQAGYGSISWHRAATEDEIGQFTTNKITLKQYFIFKKDLEKGNRINFPTLLNNNKAPFLPRQFVESIPFSMEKFSEILNHFFIDSKSKDAQAIEKTIKLCEEPEVKHKEKKTCATSLESMVDFALSVLGTNKIVAITSEVQGETQKSQRYTIEEVQQVADGDTMVCHKLNYAYALHYCHFARSTKTFMVSMVGANGIKVKAVSVCHKDASFWNPKALPFVVLKVKPGTTPICHFLKDDQILFVPSETAT